MRTTEENSFPENSGEMSGLQSGETLMVKQEWESEPQEGGSEWNEGSEANERRQQADSHSVRIFTLFMI